MDETIIDEVVAGFDIVFLLGRELDERVGYADESIIDEMIACFDIVVTGPTLPAFPSQLVPTTFTV